MESRHRDSGQVVPMAAVLVVIAAVVALCVVDGATVLGGRAAAQSAADAAALAAAGALYSGRDAGQVATEYAKRNGASLVKPPTVDARTMRVDVWVAIDVHTVLLGTRTVQADARAAVG